MQPASRGADSDPRARAAWLLFDWAAQPYHTLITAFIFAPYFSSQLIGEPTRGQAIWGYVQSLTGLAIALGAPLLGLFADRSGRLKELLFALSVIYVAGCALLWQAVPGTAWLAGAAVAAAGFAIEIATVLTNTMLPRLAAPGRMGALSGSAWALGFIGGLASLAVTVIFLTPVPGSETTLAGLAPAFGIEPVDGGPARATGPLAAVWYAVFVIPLFLWVPRSAGAGGLQDRDIRTSLRELAARRGLLVFLAARLAYQDGLLAVFAFGGIYAAGLLGWDTMELGLFGILLTVTGAIGAYAGGRLDDAVGAKPVIATTIAMCIAALATIAMIPVPDGPPSGLFSRSGDQLFLLAGTLVGVAAGPLQSASRSYLARLAPADELGAYFGFYAFSGKAVSFTGPLLVALATDAFASQRAGLAPIAILMSVGLVLLLAAPSDRNPTVPTPGGDAPANAGSGAFR